MRGDAERLRDVLEAIEQIRKYSSKGREAFERDEVIQVWIVHHLARLGEAAARLPPALRKRRGWPGNRSSGCGTSSCTNTFGLRPRRCGLLSNINCHDLKGR